MKKIKSFFCLILCMLLTLCVPLSACAPSTSEPTNVVLLDFTDETETVGLGEDYELPKGVAFDEAGNDYRVSYEVKDSKGESVQILNGKFKVKEMGEAKYVITATAKITDEQSLTRKITLNVIDRTGPNITIEPTAFAFVGEEYTISGVEVSDNSGETVAPSYKVTKKSDGSEVAVENGKFTPDSKGEYTLEVTAKDSTGNEGVNTAPIYVREPMGQYVVENFNDEYGLPVFSVKQAGYTTEDVVYHETFDPTPENPNSGDERVGVAQGNSVLAGSAQYGPHFYFKFHSSFKDIDFEYLYMKAYIQSTCTGRPQVALYSQNEPLGDNANGGFVNVNEWIEIRLTAEDICSSVSAFADKNALREGETPIDCFKRRMTNDSGNYLFFLQLATYEVGGETLKDSATDYMLYVDEIGYKPMFNPTLDIQDSYDLGTTLTVEPTVATDEAEGDYRIETKITDPSGGLVTLDNNQFRLIETGDYTIELTYVGAQYNGYTKYTVTATSAKSIQISEYTGTPVQGDTVTIPTATIDGGDVTATVRIGGCNIPMASANTFVASVAGDYVVTYSSEIDELVYKNTLTIPVTRAQVKANEVVSFDGQMDISNTIEQDSTISWLASYEGATGVAKMTSTGAWGHFGFKPLQDMSAYAESDFIVFRMYIESGYTGVLWLGGGNNCLTTIETDKWLDYYFPAEVFKTQWADFATEYYVYNMALVSSTACTIYVDEIYTASVTPATGTQILTFSEKGQIGYTKTHDSTITWQDSYQGATGVAKMTATGAWGHFGFKPLQDMSVYAESDFVVFRMYIENAVTLWFGGGNNCQTTIQTGVWKDYYFPAQVFKTNWANCTTAYDIYSMALVSNTACTIYIDEIYTVNVTPATGNQILTLAEKAQVGGYTVPNATSTITWEESFEGATGVAKVTTSGTWGFFGVKPMQDMSVYADSQYVVFRMYFADGFSGNLWFGDANNCLNKADIVAGQWVDCYFPAKVFKTNWANWETNYNAQKMCLAFSANVGTVYIDEVYTTGTMPTGNEILTFSEKAQLGYTVNNETSTITWAESYQDATGVAKVTTSGSWGFFGIKPMQDMSAYADSQYVVFRMYFVDGFSGSLWFGDDNNCLNATDIVAGQWVDCYFPAEIFKTNWANWETNYNAQKMCLAFSANVGTVYIDEVFVTNEMPA